MTLLTFKTIFSSVAVFSLVSCANWPNKASNQRASNTEAPRVSAIEEEDGRQVTKAAANEVNAHNFVEIQFPQSSAFLTRNATSLIEEAILQARKRGEIKQVIVLSWADEEYPSKRTNKLSKIESTLADERNASIKKFFSSMKRVDIDTYNMAERPNTLSKLFNSTDSKLKDSLTAAGLPTTGDELQYPSKASHAVILIKVDQ